MTIKGRYRDTFYRDGVPTKITPWQPNAIVPDFGRYLALLMKKDYPIPMGVDFIALGRGSNNWTIFKQGVIEYFNSSSYPKPLEKDNFWVWAKQIEPADMYYLDDEGKVAVTRNHRLGIEVTINKQEPWSGAFTMEEFALLGVKGNKPYDDGSIFFIDYVNHGPVIKNNDIEFSRTIELIFPADRNRNLGKEET